MSVMLMPLSQCLRTTVLNSNLRQLLLTVYLGFRHTISHMVNMFSVTSMLIRNFSAANVKMLTTHISDNSLLDSLDNMSVHE